MSSSIRCTLSSATMIHEMGRSPRFPGRVSSACCTSELSHCCTVAKTHRFWHTEKGKSFTLAGCIHCTEFQLMVSSRTVWFHSRCLSAQFICPCYCTPWGTTEQLPSSSACQKIFCCNTLLDICDSPSTLQTYLKTRKLRPLCLLLCKH